MAGNLREHLQPGHVRLCGVAGADRRRAPSTRAADGPGRGFDAERGGFGGAPKFPPSMVLEFLLRHAARTQGAADARRDLRAMARGGMHDQLGGGFARYSVDADWVVPHFEKMLYDNALLLRVYAQWGRGGRRAAEASPTSCSRELRTPEGGFASALDADTEGEEGTFYVWTPQQLVTSWARTTVAGRPTCCR